jgi:glutamate---cysteine ligase / carboxylate-amine ligase
VRVEFNASPGASLGIEVETAIVNTRDGALACAAPEVLEVLGRAHPDGEHPKIKPELYQCTLEVITGVCQTVAEARADLQASLDDVRAVLDPMDLDIVSAGVHPFTPWEELERSAGDRYAEIIDRLQWTGRRLTTHGIHYHVGIRSAEKAIAITNAMATYLPILLVLSGSSPFHNGNDTGLSSVRTKIFESLPTTGLPPHLANWAEFERFMEAMINAGTISTIREVWWDIRPHPNFGTIELRMCDAMPTLTEICALAAFSQCLVQYLDEEIDAGQQLPRNQVWMLRDNKWRAARFGLDAELVVNSTGQVRPVVEIIEDTLEQLQPTARALGCETELADVHRILAARPSADRQRSVFQKTGSLSDVVASLRAELRTDTIGAAP